MAYTLVHYEDWVVLYDDDGRKVEEGHSIPIHRVFELLDVKLTSRDATEAEAEDAKLGVTPDRIR